jgi:class 3 adenylate cyclase
MITKARERFPFDLLEDPAELASFEGWSEHVYRDLMALQEGSLSRQDFDEKDLRRSAILVLDLTGFTETTIRGGAPQSFLRILDAQRVCLPVLRQRGAGFVRTFADDIVALFDDPGPALDAALDIHARTWEYQKLHPREHDPAECCIGIGFGPIYAIGPNHAMGDEMNRASKLGEDTARGGETLVTEGAYATLEQHPRVRFEPQADDDLLFPFYRATRSS